MTNILGASVYLQPDGRFTLAIAKMRKGVVTRVDEMTGIATVRLDGSGSQIEIPIWELVPETLRILRQRISELPPDDVWKVELNHKTLEELGGWQVVKAHLPSRVRTEENFLLNDYEMRVVSENGPVHLVTFATTLMAWKRAMDDKGQ